MCLNKEFSLIPSFRKLHPSFHRFACPLDQKKASLKVFPNQGKFYVFLTHFFYSDPAYDVFLVPKTPANPKFNSGSNFSYALSPFGSSGNASNAIQAEMLTFTRGQVGENEV